jgi:alcohol dehydrogenase class IV
MQSFTYDTLPSRVVFGWDSLARLPEEIDRLGAKRVLVLATPPHHAEADRIASLIGARSAGVFAGAVMHTPVAVTEQALRIVREQGIDATLAIGGGSTTGLGKAIALRTDLPQIVVPTTYAGSEMTPILGETEGGRKTTRRDPKILPEVVVYDPVLTLSLPPALSATSGMNAVAHAVEALYAQDRNPIVSLMSEDAIRALAEALPIVTRDPNDREARERALYGAWLCGVALGTVGMALHHKLCHVLGGSFDLPHAETHAVVLPHAVAFNAPAAPEAMAAVERALGERALGWQGPAALGLRRLAERIGAPVALKDIGMPYDGIDRAADQAVANPYWNPRPLERQAIRALIDDAWHGRQPGAVSSRAAPGSGPAA